MDDIYFGEEDAKYIKSKSKKKVKKSKHKHSKVYCVAKVLSSTSYKPLISYCNECGKIDNVFFLPNPKTVDRLIKQNRIIEVDTIHDLMTMKYVPIVKE